MWQNICKNGKKGKNVPKRKVQIWQKIVYPGKKAQSDKTVKKGEISLKWRQNGRKWQKMIKRDQQ